MTISIMTLSIKVSDIQHNDTQHNDTQHNDTQHKYIQHNVTQLKDIQHKDILHKNMEYNDIIYWIDERITNTICIKLVKQVLTICHFPMTKCFWYFYLYKIRHCCTSPSLFFSKNFIMTFSELASTSFNKSCAKCVIPFFF